MSWKGTLFSLTFSFFGKKCSANSLTVWLKTVTTFLTVQSVQMSVSILAGCKMLLVTNITGWERGVHMVWYSTTPLDQFLGVTYHAFHKVAWNNSHPIVRSYLASFSIKLMHLGVIYADSSQPWALCGCEIFMVLWKHFQIRWTPVAMMNLSRSM